MSEMNENIIKARGLPWSATPKDVLSFFDDCNIVGGENGVHLTMDRNGRPSGECFIELASKMDVEKANSHNKEHMGKRYIEIQDAKRAEMEWFVNRMPGGGGAHKMGGGGDGANDGFVRLRGLPFEATKKDIAAFFVGIEIAPYGITLTMDQDGRPSGDAYVEFTSPDEAEKALQKNKERIGHRYIEIFKSSKHDVKYVVPSGNAQGGGFPQMMGGRPGPYDRPGGFGGGMNMGQNGGGFNRGGGFAGGRNPSGGGGGGPGGPMRGPRNIGSKGLESSTTGHMVHMRGLPFGATQGDVYQFLAPLNPVEVRLLHEEGGRPKGECDVDFHTHSDAEAAMLKNKQNMGHRYIEMFLRSASENGGGGNNFSTNGSFNQSNSQSNGGMMNTSGGQHVSNTSAGGYGGGYGSGFGGGSGGGLGGAGSGGGLGGMGGVKEEFGLGTGTGYSSFNEKTNYSNLPQSTGNYYSSMR